MDYTDEKPTEQRREFLIATMSAYYSAINATDIFARCDGFKSPGLIEGSVSGEIHRPDIICTGPDSKKTQILCDVVMPGDLNDKKLGPRLCLFSQACQAMGAELHIAVHNVKLKTGQTLGQTIREKAPLWGVQFKTLFEV